MHSGIDIAAHAYVRTDDGLPDRDAGERAGTTVRVVVPATDTVELTAAELESGMADAIESAVSGPPQVRPTLRCIEAPDRSAPPRPGMRRPAVERGNRW